MKITWQAGIIFMLFFMKALGVLNAQSIKGCVKDSVGSPVDGATVILQTADSVFVDATITDTCGVFCLHFQPSHYRLVVQHLLYEPRVVEGKGADAGVIMLASKHYGLDEVVVRGERPVVKVEGGSLVYDVPRLMENKLVTNAYECIRELPGVMEKENGLVLAGASSLSVIIDGKPSTMTGDQLMNLLKNIPASRVERAEIMYSAPPQYHVRGAAINVVLSKNDADKPVLQGEITGSYEQKNEAGGTGSVALTYGASKWNADFMYGVEDLYSRQTMDFSALHTVEGEVHDMRHFDDGRGRTLTHTLRAGGEYRFDEKNSLGISYTASLTPRQKNMTNSLGNFSDARNDHRTESKMHNVALHYESGFGLKAGVDYTHYTSDDTQNFLETYDEEPDMVFESLSDQRIDRWKLYADQRHEFPRGWFFNYGASFAYVNNRNRQYYDIPALSAQNMEVGIGEYTYNLYAGFDKNFGKKWSLGASAAVEYYKMADTYRKWAVYPAMQLSYTPEARHIFQLSFSSDKTYPDYWTLSGATEYGSSYMLSVGNAFLKPYTSYETSLSYILRNKYVFRLFYDYSPDYFMQMVYLDSKELHAVYNFQNWDFVKTFGVMATIPYRIGEWWDSNLTLVFQQKHDKASHYYNAPFDNKCWAGIGVWSNTFALSRQPDIKMEIFAFGQTAAIQGAFDLRALGYVDAALRYTFAGGKVMIRLKGSDLFGGMDQMKLTVRNGLQHVDMGVANYNRAFTLTFSYKFGGYKEKELKDVDTSRFKH